MSFKTTTGLILASAALVLLVSTPAVAQCENCGPGNHWVDTCAAGSDPIPLHGAVFGIDTNFNCLADASFKLSVCGGSPQLVNRSAPLDDSNNYPGTRLIDTHLDVIDTEIVDMCMTDGAVTMVAGAGMGQGGVLSPTLGAIAEKLADNQLADSFFDVMFEIDLGGGNYVYNQVPLRMATPPDGGINCVPPDTDYFHPVSCLPLYDAPVGGNLVANLVMAQHYIGGDEPATGACCLILGDYKPIPTCLPLTEDLCDLMSDGVYRGDDVSCLTDTCRGIIPAVSEWGLVVMVLLVLAAGTVVIVRRRAILARG